KDFGMIQIKPIQGHETNALVTHTGTSERLGVARICDANAPGRIVLKPRARMCAMPTILILVLHVGMCATVQAETELADGDLTEPLGGPTPTTQPTFEILYVNGFDT